ncbi:hypothetical protein ASG01_10995 [Chryseobacterium sp. Leaf180]|uniref:DUF2071 domain-containing protein n=1 Tax=Chryseobacterium sp. Leaf180 TaxID=1736289 RepID=UPI0006FB14E7|nr:DUF2071 domain-containing protein [Chryseobacterium sp. Leaf180]KQR92441.1 hypothetical protein ASG01_10995 [Chryseobacterium sp. Leaf180]
MKIPTIHGYIERRILINFTAEPHVVQNILPKPFRPKLFNNKAIVGICLIRLKDIKPKGFPDFMGINSENGAHRIAVEWDEDGETKTGVYIPRRDTSLKLNALVGGRIFPGKHEQADFEVKEAEGKYHVGFTSTDGTQIVIDAAETDVFPSGSVFKTLDNASQFFESGDLGYSPNRNTFEGLRLKAYSWKVRPLNVQSVKSSFFEDPEIFPAGSIQFDNALLMTDIEHEWIAASMKLKE